MLFEPGQGGVKGDEVELVGVEGLVDPLERLAAQVPPVLLATDAPGAVDQDATHGQLGGDVRPPRPTGSPAIRGRG